MFGELAHYFPILFWKFLKYELGSPEWKASLVQVELFCWGMKNWNTIQRKYIKKCTGHLSQGTKKNPSRTHITYHHRIFVMQLLFYQELLKNNNSCSTKQGCRTVGQKLPKILAQLNAKLSNIRLCCITYLVQILIPVLKPVIILLECWLEKWNVVQNSSCIFIIFFCIM